MPAFLSDLRFGARVLRKSPGFSLVAVAVLALGIGANSAMFTIVNALLFRPLAGKADELVGLYSQDRTKPDSYRAFSYPEFVDARERSDVFDGLMAHTFALVGLPKGDGMRQTFADVVSSNFFDTLGVQLARGRTFTAEEERPGARIPVVIVGQDRASLLGQTMKLNTIDFTVVGVVPRGFTGTMALLAPELWLPLGMYDTVVNDIFRKKNTGLQDRTNRALVIAGRLKEGITPAVAAARLDAVSRQLEAAYPAENKNQVLTVNPLSRISTSTSPRTDTGLGTAAGLLMGLAGIVLLIACLNIANMLLARGTARRKELAIRLAVGGARGRIVRQLLTEGLLLALAGAGGGLVLAFRGTRGLVRSLETVMPLALVFDPRPDMPVMLATTAFAIVATMIFALGPALKLSRVDLVSDLKELASDAHGVLGRRFSARNAMVVGQIALSLMLLSVGGLFARGALKAAGADPGFSYRRQLLVSTDPALVQYDDRRGRAAHRGTLERLRALQGVEAVGMASTVPFGAFHEGRQVERVGHTADQSHGPEPTFRIVSADYFRALGLQMVRGREFSNTEEDAASAPRVAIIDQTLARQVFGSADPLGQSIRFSARPDQQEQDATPLEVVGIAPPIRDELFDRQAGPAVYVPSGRNYRSQMHFHVRVARTGAEGDLLATIRRELRTMDPRLPVVEATTLQSFHNQSVDLWAVRAGGRLFLLFGLLALALTVVGLYGVKSYLVAQRTREIGIRMALGADSGAVLRMVLKEGAALAAVGIAIGLPLAAALGRLLSSMLYDMQALDPAVFTAAPFVLGAAALVATYLPARRATRVTPVTALRL